MEEHEMKNLIEAELAKQPGRLLNASGAPNVAGQAVLEAIRKIVADDLRNVSDGGGHDVPN
jgi:hypothetical protein